MARPAATASTRDRILMLIGSGRARSRGDLADALGSSPSTVSQHVQALINAGLIEEGEARESSGGRKPRELRLVDGDEHMGVIDLGGRHARLGVVRRGGTIVATREVPVDLRQGAPAVLAAVGDGVQQLLAEAHVDGRLIGTGIALPGPVDVLRRAVESPSRMPGWQGHDIGALLEETMGVPAVVENDANAMALGEHFDRAHPVRHSVTVKAGTAIGAGVVVDGQVYRGAGGVAGDITHTRVSAAGETPCSCGNRGCLETVASGAALAGLLAGQGYPVETTADVLALVRDADPVATTLARTAGRHLGEVLCAVVNFFNPGAVYLGGALATLEPFVSAIRSQIYEGAHPMMTRALVIEPSRLGADANLAGVARILDETLFERAG
ncbi:ROK family transcriptional regulator [Ruania alba]|uniref:Sugar kinase of the NBD/HSP70 family, may contain an N-terminal HTH domain n=1 Tax=Ruania alba TaxID=648782 RepID=A0A1H5MWI4_9MICO|nr:ROK family transcriptional regulator [Ruania alba]SEE93653.1 Sugar kinase of the NBD/HSP70 family, may contain an N-terminal HTH domain [Ruania alba]